MHEGEASGSFVWDIWAVDGIGLRADDGENELEWRT